MLKRKTNKQIDSRIYSVQIVCDKNSNSRGRKQRQQQGLSSVSKQQQQQHCCDVYNITFFFV